MTTEAMFTTISEQLNSGILVLDLESHIVSWNRFIATHANKELEQVKGKSVFDVFPELPKRWFEMKVAGVVQLKSPFFCSWEQRHHLFELPHNRPITTDSHFMAQNCTFLPIEKDGKLSNICILIEDATDVYHYESKLKQTMEALELTTRIDGLTQIYNRKFWQESLLIEFSRTKRHGHSLSLLMFDLDHFKKLNDNFGHQCGDLVLIETAHRIKQLLRTADIFGRYGGEEFAVILPETDLNGAFEVAERIRYSLSSSPVIYNGHEVTFSASIGVAIVEDHHESIEILISDTDSALYSAKSSGRNQIVIAQSLNKCS